MTETARALSIGHVGLNVTDLDRSVAFYAEVFGLRLLDEGRERDRRYAFLGADDAAPVLTLWQQCDGSFEPERPGLHHLAFEAPDIDAVRRAESSLRAVGGHFAHAGLVRHRESSASVGIFFEDPDGIRLEIFAADGATVEPAPSGDAPACGFF